MNELIKEEMNKKSIGNEYTPTNFIYWRHFTFSDMLGYCGAYFIPDNKYELDRVFITGEFRNVDNTRFSATFALNMEEVIIINMEIGEVKWKCIPR